LNKNFSNDLMHGVLSAFENRALRRLSGPKRQEDEQSFTSYTLHKILFRVTKSRRMILAGYVARVRHMLKPYKIIV